MRPLTRFTHKFVSYDRALFLFKLKYMGTVSSVISCHMWWENHHYDYSNYTLQKTECTDLREALRNF